MVAKSAMSHSKNANVARSWTNGISSDVHHKRTPGRLTPASFVATQDGGFHCTLRADIHSHSNTGITIGSVFFERRSAYVNTG